MTPAEAGASAPACCFTGHRVIPQKHLHRLIRYLDQAVAGCLSLGVTTFRSGGALGFDTLAAQAVVRARHVHPQARLELILPCRDQSAGWRPEQADALEALKTQADAVSYCFEQYMPGCMQARNRRLVEGSCRVIAYCTRARGGTVQTLTYAIERGLPVLNLASLPLEG